MEGKKKVSAAALLLLILLSIACICAAAEGSQPGYTPEIRMDPAEMTLRKGQTRNIRFYVSRLPAGVQAKKYEWASSNPDAAVYNKGTVQALGLGETEISCTVTLTDGTSWTASCRVSVTVPVTGLQAAERSVTIMAGETCRPEITVLPEDASNRGLLFRSSNEDVVRVREDGTFEAAAEGRAEVTVTSAENAGKTLRIQVKVIRRVGKADRELIFQRIPWGSDHETCVRMLKEAGIIAESFQGEGNFSPYIWHWPENDLLFSLDSKWKTLPVIFSDRETGAKRVSIDVLKTIGGFMPQTTNLIYLGGIGEDGKADSTQTRLIGVYFHFDNRHAEGTTVFTTLLEKLEAQYGAFNRYISKDFARYYGDMYGKIRTAAEGAKAFDIQELGTGTYLGEGMVCTIYGENNTGIMLKMDTAGTVTLFYGRTDAEEMIRGLAEALAADQEVPEDAGL